MLKRIILLFLSAVLLITASACDEKPPADKAEKTASITQFVIAMDPVITTNNDAVISARHEIASAMSRDAAAKTKSELYESTGWQWIRRKNSDSLQWNLRDIRSLSPWCNGSLKSDNKAPYSYLMTDDGASSIAVYDSSKLDVAGYSQNMIPAAGLLLAFTGKQEEAICYTAQEDCVVTVSDVNRGNIAAVQAVSGLLTDTLSGDAPKGIILRLYYNNRLLWQDILGNAALLGSNISAVEFPHIADLSLSAGDSLAFTVQAVESSENFEAGYEEFGPQNSTETKKLSIAREILLETEESDEKQNESTNSKKTVQILKDGVNPFNIIISANAVQEIYDVANSLKRKMSAVLDAPVAIIRDDSSSINDSGRYLYIGETKFAESKKAVEEIKKYRTANAADYILRLLNEDTLIVAGATRVGLQLAVDDFVDKYCKNENSAIPEDLNYISSVHHPLQEIKIDGQSVKNYRIVTSRFASISETLAADYLIGEIAKQTGYLLENARDNTSLSACEIVIGETNRTSIDYYIKATKTVSNSFQIALKDKRLTVSGNGTAVNAGVVSLAARLKSGNIPAGYTHGGSYDNKYSLTNSYKLAWADEFNEAKLGKEWTNIYEKHEYLSFLNSDIYKYPGNTWLKDGAMVQRFNYDGATNNFGGADVESSGRMYYQFGIIELRVKFTLDPGTWSAFWTRGPVGKEFLEVDIYEMFGRTNHIAHNLHTWASGGSHVNIGGGVGTGGGTLAQLSTTLNEPFGNAYHTVGVMWTADEIRFFVDGKWTWVFDYSDPKYDSFKQPTFIKIGGTPGNKVDWGNLPTPPVTPGVDWEDFQYYDWVRLYQNEEPDTFLYNIANK